MKLYDKTLSTVYEEGRSINLWNIFFPKLMELVSVNLLGSIHSMLLANFDQEAAVAVSVGSQVVSILLSVFCIFSTGHLIVSSIHLGAKDRTAAGISACSVLTASTVISLIAGILLAAFPQPFMRLMHLEGKAFQYGCTYFSIMMGFSVVSVWISCFNSFNVYDFISFLSMFHPLKFRNEKSIGSMKMWEQSQHTVLGTNVPDGRVSC